MSKTISIAFQTDKSAAEYIALAKLVDQYAFDKVTVYCDAPYHPSFGPLLLMAPHIHKAQIGAAAIAPSRIHPIDIASQTALLADVAQAGIYIGIARGAWLAEHAIPEAKPPIQSIRETIEVMRYLLRGKTGGYEGTVYQLAPHVHATYPLPKNDIPILVGTWGAKLSAVAGELADEVKVGGSANPDLVPVIQDYIAVGEEKAGREKETVGVVIGAVSVIDEDREAARQAARRSVALYLPVIAGLDPTLDVDPELLKRIETHVNHAENELAAALISDDLLDRFAFAGNAADMIQHTSRLFEAGTSRVEFGTPHGLNQPEIGIQILGETIVPELKRLWT